MSLIFVAVIISTTFAQGDPTPDPQVNEILGYLAPLIVMGITALMRKWAPDLSGWVIVMIIVPGISAVLAYLATILVPGLGWGLTFLLGLLSIVFNEFRKQLGQGNDNSPNYPPKK